MGTVAVYLGIKRLGCEGVHSIPHSDEVKTSGAIPPRPHMFNGIVLNCIMKYGKNFAITVRNVFRKPTSL
jgi:hypothetical protein